MDRQMSFGIWKYKSDYVPEWKENELIEYNNLQEKLIPIKPFLKSQHCFQKMAIIKKINVNKCL